jgi:hypothetical protein
MRGLVSHSAEYNRDDFAQAHQWNTREGLQRVTGTYGIH